jgi:LPXTG-motif cell wall-anchored protein
MKRIRLLVALAVAGLLLVSATAVFAADPVNVTLTAQNDSGENGAAVLTDLGNGKVRVEVNVTGAPAGVAQPLHIHQGTCANLTAKPTYPLTSAMDGVSVTEIDANLADLQNGDFAINGHKSAEEASVYVFCGNIPALAAATLPATGADFTTNLLLAAVLGLALFAAGFVVLRTAPRKN